MRHMHGQCLYMEKQLNSQPLIDPLFLINTQQNKYKQYLALLYIMHMLLIPIYCQHSMKFPTSRPNQHRKQWKHTDNLWTMYTHPKVLPLVSDSAYLVLPDVRSCCATLYTLTDISTSKPPNIKSNGPWCSSFRYIYGCPMQSPFSIP